MARSLFKPVAALGVVAILSACETTEPGPGFAATDPYEPSNRAVNQANIELDTLILRPVSEAYGILTPTLVKHLISNGLSHIALANDLANYVLQGDVERALDTLGRFTINTVLGAGVLDPASEFGLPRQPTDFGLTLASHGVGEGDFLILPLLGPSTQRDAIGFVVDRFMSPTFLLGQVTAMEGLSEAGLTLTGLSLTEQRSANAAAIDDLLYESEDSYVTLRAGYLQRRRAQALDQDALIDALPDIFDDEAPAD